VIGPALASTSLARPSPRLLGSLEGAAPGAVLDRAIDRLARAHDASHVLMVPSVVVAPRDAAGVAAVLAAVASLGTSATFRSGGTSLSGQAVTDQVLVDTRRWLRGVEVLDDGLRVRVQPGATLRAVNARLAPYGRRLGPDPASDIACTMGGIIANNSSGMTCGTERNSYRTLDSLEVVLPTGSIIDTGAAGADERLRALEPRLHAGLATMRDRVLGDDALTGLIRTQFAIKNTMGYRINAFLDHDAPVDILAHLLVGSEDTLGFVASAVLRTVPVAPLAATTLLVFADLPVAVDALPTLIASGAAAVELLDATSLRVAQADRRVEVICPTFACARRPASSSSGRKRTRRPSGPASPRPTA
jgi:D-lactate dehydrogenase